MKIDPNTLGLPQTSSAGTGRASSPRNIEKLYGSNSSPISGTESSAAGDAVQLSELSAALTALSPDSPERTARVEELSKLVESGEYKVEVQDLSRRLAGEYLS